MDEQKRQDFLTALGEEFCYVLEEVVDADLCNQDGYEVFVKVLGKDIGPDKLTNLTDAQFELLSTAACKLFECDDITDDDLREVVKSTLDRW